jgi:hypothetical protein
MAAECLYRIGGMMMTITWESALQHYRSLHFQVFTREQLLHDSLEILLRDIPTSPATISFLHSLSQPQMSLWESFFTSILSVHRSVQEHKVFAPLRRLLNDATRVAVLFGEHVAWKSPDKWSYLFEVRDGSDRNVRHYVIAHPPATTEQIQQAEAVLRIQLPPKYVQFLQATNGLGIALDEVQFICGVGHARAKWDDVLAFQSGAPLRDEHHEIASYWLQWQDVLTYERQRDRETGINTFRSDERVCVPFAYTIDDWCFNRSQPNDEGEYPILFWDHELRQAYYEYPDFEAWFLDIVVHRPI